MPGAMTRKKKAVFSYGLVLFSEEKREILYSSGLRSDMKK